MLLCTFFLCLTLFGQTGNKVTGEVSSLKDGRGINASVLIKGASKGVPTSADGKYSIDNVSSGAVLIFSAVGYKTLEISVKGRSVVNAALEVDQQSLDEVIMVAYGTSTRATYTGSAAVVGQSEIKDIPTESFESALVGKVAGVQVTSGSGQAGSVTSIHIRGVGSINASNEPLYVIDGVPVSSGNSGQLSDYIYSTNNVMATINPSDIESITILKDAAASSLYGSRAANGVVMVTTKKGKIGKPKISFKSALGMTPSWATDNYEPAGIQEQVNMMYQVYHDYRTSAGKDDAYANNDALNRLKGKFNKHGYTFETAGTGLYENVMIKGMTDGKENREGKYFDWENAMFRTGIYNSNDISVSGGNESTKYYSSLSYTKDQNRIRINDFDRVTGRVNLSQKIGKFVEFISNVNIGKTNKTGFNDTRNTGGNYFMQSRNLSWPLYWPTDYKTDLPWTARYGSYAQNSIYYDKEWENSSSNLRISANESIVVNILPDLNVKSVFSYDNTQSKDHLYYSAKHFNVSPIAKVDELTTNANRLVSSTTLNYNKTFGVHGLGLLAGYEAEKNLTDFQRSTGTDLPSSGLHTVATAGKKDASAYSWSNSLTSILSRVEYNYDQKYYASASYRRDGSSKLGPDTRYGDFWSVAGSWRINKESFMANSTLINDLRLRASYGVNGTLPSDNYGWRSLVTYGNKYLESAGGGISTIADPNLRWETSYTSNLGLDFGLLNQRIYGTIEYFNRTSKDLLQDVPISGVTGFSSVLKNVGEINNHGLEVSLGGDILRTGNLRWSANLNASFIKSKVNKLYANEGETKGQDIIWYDPTGGDARAQYIYREGESTYSFFGYEWAGVDPETGKSRYYVNDPTDAKAGEFELNGRGATYDFGDANYVILGSAMPKVFGGFSTDLEYKGITLGLNFNYKIGGYIYDGAFKDVADDGYYWERIRSKYYYDNLWTPDHKNALFPKLSGNDLTDPQEYSSRQMYDASFVRLKNVTLAYNLPKSLISKIGVSNTRIYFNGTNLLTFSKYKIADPEVNSYGTRGWETPIGKVYTFGIEFSF